MTVHLVGAGPGDPGLLTRRGAELLAAADVVVHDRLASRELLALAKPGAEVVDVGKAPGRAPMSQADINALLVDRARAGLEVVRLKGGDPFVFGRGGEEAEACIAAGLEFTVVPGVTSAIAAAAYAGIPVTHRGLSTSVTIVTGHEDPAKGEPDTDWDALARVDGTLVVLMGAARIAEIAKALVAGGRAPDTQVAVIRWGTRPEQRTQRATLATVATLDIEPPSAIVVGDVAGLDLGWFERRPLFGRTIVVTRAREQASALRARLEALGAAVLEMPAIAIEPLPARVPSLAGVAWVVFTSPNGVEAFFDALAREHLDARALASARVAVIGPGTADALRARGLRADLVPPRFVAESLVDVFPAGTGRVLLPRAERARDVLPDGLAAKGYEVEVVPVYRTVPAPVSETDLTRLQSGDVDAVTFTSSSTVEHFCDAVGRLPVPLPRVFSIGPVTSATARQRGLQVDGEADPHTIEGLVDVVVRTLRDRN